MHLLPGFDYYEPKEMSEACKLLAQLSPAAKIIAGGTDLLVNMKKGLLRPQAVISFARVPGLADVEPRNSGITIGSHIIIEKLTEFDIIKKKYGLLSKAAAVLGSPLVRNRATIGGNLVTARPAADMPPPLLAMGAKVLLKSEKKEREVSLDDFFKGPGETVIEPDEILTSILLEEAPPFTGDDYIKLMHRRSLEIAIVAVASRITLDKPDGVVKNVRIIMSAVAPKAIHARLAEEILAGEKPTEDLVNKVARQASQECTPIDDIRGGAGYRCAMVEHLTKRTLTRALAAAKEKK
ncbi:MAG: aerobic-type carbon monoxide dehydrogenase, middle subunit CoxM/CutM-like protein [Deltaproteobacteria bacterium]|nr:aerobic-type carbon monoxide dehydrogenase, middle subunit CoxM/CutM-like protein [Deltaproteobacteria bacterium]